MALKSLPQVWPEEIALDGHVSNSAQRNLCMPSSPCASSSDSALEMPGYDPQRRLRQLSTVQIRIVGDD